MKVEKNNSIVTKINKTKEEKYPDLYKMQQDRLREIQQQKKAFMKAEEKKKKMDEIQRKKEIEERSYDRIFQSANMTSNAEKEASADTTAAEAYEDDFF